MILGLIFILGCKEVEKVECYNEEGKNKIEASDIEEINYIEKDKENIESEKEKIKVTIRSDKASFFHDGVRFTPIIEGNIDKKIQYHWIVEENIYNDGEFYSLKGENIDGFIGDKGPYREIINDGEIVEFAPYNEVSYVDGDYRENKIILQIEEKDTGKILAKDEATIENRQGAYFVKTSENERFKDKILKTEKAKLYGEIFDLVWEIDKGLNDDLKKYINIDTKSFEDFSQEDNEQLFEYISKKYSVTMLDKTFKELEDEGYIKNLSFKDGLVFNVNKYLKNNSNEVSLEGMKWVSGIGAIGFIAEAEKINERWIIRKCQMTRIS
ncbi:hypothetical protein HMPREF0216_02707 [Clostridium celatum DSM 1785]|uniref:Uncharacterized protein n=1 Tax=Clostridium celatum DSM 1785 TaxID=545697 RepID=L1Q9X8_9CLOT|nr:hypothetical protein HMPREF0216_02707 [Clostridium celatum DSM 1785]